MLDLAKLRKVWALASSPNANEAAVARAKAEAMMKAAGKTMADLPGVLLAGGGRPDPNDIFAGFADRMEAKEPGWKVRETARRAEKARQEAEERAAVIARYGSEEAVEAFTPLEEEYRAAVRQWSTFQEPPYETRWVESVDGYKMYGRGDPPPRVLAAIASVRPLPRTIAEAKAEYDAWERRSRDLGLIFDNLGDLNLDLPVYIRYEMVRKLLETGIRARTLEDVLIRQRYCVESDISEPEVDKAVLADLEALASVKRTVAPAVIELPDPADHLDAPYRMAPAQALGWAKGWNACREEMLKRMKEARGG